MTVEFSTREEWLNAFIEEAKYKFVEINAPIPGKVRVSVGFTSGGARGKSIGECWSDMASEDGYFEIFLRPSLDEVSRICDVLTHELVHAAVGLDKGHNAHFKRVATSLGLGGKMTATVAKAEWYEWALPIIERLGPLPHAKLNDGIRTGRPKQKTALLKLECPECGWLCRATAKHIDPYDDLMCPTGCGGILRSDFYEGAPGGED